MYQVRVERDSVNAWQERLATFVITLPRPVLAEAVTHRTTYDSWGYEDGFALCERVTPADVSKSSGSSRAIPFRRMMDKVLENPYVPAFTRAGPGMQGAGFLSPSEQAAAERIWLSARDAAVAAAETLVETHQVHKQDANRLVEPWAWVTQVVTSSRWDNFFALRCHQAAHPALRTVARMMYVALSRSTPKKLEWGQWHLPFVKPEEADAFEWKPRIGGLVDARDMPDLIQFSAARCAWVSYENHDRDGSAEKMRSVYHKLIAEQPVHASPVEHQATPPPYASFFDYAGTHLRSNLTGYVQARKLVPFERIDRYEPTPEEVASWGIPADNLWPT